MCQLHLSSKFGEINSHKRFLRYCVHELLYQMNTHGHTKNRMMPLAANIIAIEGMQTNRLGKEIELCISKH